MSESQDHDRAAPPRPALPVLVARCTLGGLLMGLANLVPGISGATMLLAAGVYPQFVGAVADVTRRRFSGRALLVLGVVAAAAVVGFVGLAGIARDLVVNDRWIMYSLFIGLTLGGVPVLWRMLGQIGRSAWVGAVCGFVLMAVLAVLQNFGPQGGGGMGEGPGAMFFAGLLGASAMILPGLSGGYLLLVFGLYVPLLSGVEALRQAAAELAWGQMGAVTAMVVLPAGVGVVAGVVGVSHLVRWLLDRFREVTLGVLMGLLAGAVAGLWPFQRGRVPAEGELVRGRTMTPERIEGLDPAHYPIEFFAPSAGEVVAAMGLIVAGFIITGMIARLGRGGGGVA